MTAGRTWQGKLGGVLEWIWGWHWMALPRLKNVEHIQWHHLSIKAGGLQTAQQGTQPRAFEPKSTIVTVKKVTLAQSHISTHRHRQTQPQTDSHTHTQTHTDTHTHTHRHTDTQTHTHTHRHPHTHTHRHTRSSAHEPASPPASHHSGCRPADPMLCDSLAKQRRCDWLCRHVNTGDHLRAPSPLLFNQ